MDWCSFFETFFLMFQHDQILVFQNDICWCSKMGGVGKLLEAYGSLGGKAQNWFRHPKSKEIQFSHILTLLILDGDIPTEGSNQRTCRWIFCGDGLGWSIAISKWANPNLIFLKPANFGQYIYIISYTRYCTYMSCNVSHLLELYTVDYIYNLTI